MEKFPSLAFEPQHDKINKMTCAPSEDSVQPEHQPCLVRVFSGIGTNERKAKNLIRLGEWQADLSVGWAHMSFRWYCHGNIFLMNRSLLSLVTPLKFHTLPKIRKFKDN